MIRLPEQRRIFWVLVAFAIVTLVIIWGRVWTYTGNSNWTRGPQITACPPSAPCVCPPFPKQEVTTTNAATQCAPTGATTQTNPTVKSCLPQPAKGEPLRIAILTATNEGNYQMKCADMTLENKRKYATKHGYDLIVIGSILDKSRIYAWSKILALQRALSSYHYIMWIDNDAVFTNMSVKVEDRLAAAPSRADADFFIAKDFNEINAGILFMRCSDWTHQFLQRIWDRTDCVGQVWEEQLAIIKLMKEFEDVRQHSIVLDNSQSPQFQSHFQVWQKGHWVFHNAGCLWMMSEDKCLERLQGYLNQKVD